VAREELYNKARDNLITIDPQIQKDVEFVEKHGNEDRYFAEKEKAQKRIDEATQKAYEANPNAYLGLMTNTGTSAPDVAPGKFTMPDKPSGHGLWEWVQSRNDGKGEWVNYGMSDEK
jgi:hypothetical protein